MVNVLIAYGIIILIPVLIMGFSSIINSIKVGMILSFIVTISSLTYFNHLGIIPTWIIFILYILLAVIFVLFMRNLIGGNA